MFTRQEAEEILNGLSNLWDEASYDDAAIYPTIFKKLETMHPGIVADCHCEYILEDYEEDYGTDIVP